MKLINLSFFVLATLLMTGCKDNNNNTIDFDKPKGDLVEVLYSIETTLYDYPINKDAYILLPEINKIANNLEETIKLYDEQGYEVIFNRVAYLDNTTNTYRIDLDFPILKENFLYTLKVSNLQVTDTNNKSTYINKEIKFLTNTIDKENNEPINKIATTISTNINQCFTLMTNQPINTIDLNKNIQVFNEFGILLDSNVVINEDKVIKVYLTNGYQANNTYTITINKDIYINSKLTTMNLVYNTSYNADGSIQFTLQGAI